MDKWVQSCKITTSMCAPSAGEVCLKQLATLVSRLLLLSVDVDVYIHR